MPWAIPIFKTSIVRILLPVLVASLVIPLVLSPESVEYFKYSLEVTVASTSVCGTPDCTSFIESMLSTNPLLVPHIFEHFEAIYIRPVLVQRIDEGFIACLKSRTFTRFYRLIFNSEMSEKTIEAFAVGMAVFNTGFLRAVRSILLSKLHVFLIMMGLTSILVVWEPLVTAVYYSFSESNYIF